MCLVVQGSAPVLRRTPAHAQGIEPPRRDRNVVMQHDDNVPDSAAVFDQFDVDVADNHHCRDERCRVLSAHERHCRDERYRVRSAHYSAGCPAATARCVHMIRRRRRRPAPSCSCAVLRSRPRRSTCYRSRPQHSSCPRLCNAGQEGALTMYNARITHQSSQGRVHQDISALLRRNYVCGLDTSKDTHSHTHKHTHTHTRIERERVERHPRTPPRGPLGQAARARIPRPRPTPRASPPPPAPAARRTRAPRLRTRRRTGGVTCRRRSRAPARTQRDACGCVPRGVLTAQRTPHTQRPQRVHVQHCWAQNPHAADTLRTRARERAHALTSGRRGDVEGPLQRRGRLHRSEAICPRTHQRRDQIRTAARAPRHNPNSERERTNTSPHAAKHPRRSSPSPRCRRRDGGRSRVPAPEERGARLHRASCKAQHIQSSPTNNKSK